MRFDYFDKVSSQRGELCTEALLERKPSVNPVFSD